MSKKFKTRKRLKLYKIIIIFFMFLSFYMFCKWVSSISIKMTNNKFLKYLNNYNYNYGEEQSMNPFTIFNVYIKKINHPKQLLINNFVYYNSSKKTGKAVVKINNDQEPLVYIYNTHQKETYNKTYIEDYNVVPDVLMMSHIIQEKLNNEGILTIVEENDITKYLKDHDMNYAQSYQASRVFLKEVLNKYPNLKLIIDLHRDAASYDVTTVNIDDIKCSKIMFVVGKEYKNYKTNLSFVNYLNDKINQKYPLLSRGVLQKEGFGVNGVYNQDLKSNIILLELGGDKNNIDELTNTINLIVPIIKEFVNEQK